MSEIKLISWNVNGLRACLTKGFADSFKTLNADVFSLQETKMQQGQAPVDLPGYRQFWHSAEKKGYSGTAVFSRLAPVGITYGLGIEEHDHEGRVITAEYERFYLVNVYTPNSKRELERLAYRMVWENDFRAYLQKLDKVKPVVLCGDLNVAHEEIDLKNPRTNHHNAGFTDEERKKFGELLAAGFADTFRRTHPDTTGAYTWWSYLRKARETNAGWRIDYFVVSERLMPAVKTAAIHNEIFGSDHCPVELILDV